MSYDGMSLTPLFHSEISSSHLLFTVFDNHRDIASDFVAHFLSLPATDITPYREKNYSGQGSIDVFLGGKSGGIKTHVLIETKVHDYASARFGQIVNYYEAARERLPNGHVRLVYLTQFSGSNDPSAQGASVPDTIKEFTRSRSCLAGIHEQNITHVNWEEFHKFLDRHKKSLTTEERLMVELHYAWIRAKTDKDVKDNTVDVGHRDILDYFEGVSLNLQQALPFGKVEDRKQRRILTIDLQQLRHEELDKVLDTINALASSQSVGQKHARQTPEDTLSAAKARLCALTENVSDWPLLSFYARLFGLVNSTNHILLHGTGSKGFAIRVDIVGKGPVSLCTLWNNGTIEFSLKR